MSEQEREGSRSGAEEDVEGHKVRHGQEEGSEEEAGLRREDDDSDVEGHLKRH